MSGRKRPRSPPPPPQSPAPAPPSASQQEGSVGGAAAATMTARSFSNCAPAGQQRRPQRPLEIHIVEDHGDALEHLYDAIGAKRAPFKGLHWVHLDSHPDLALPADLRPETVMDPPALYEALEDSPGGNAEFILPAVFAGHVDEVWWIRPPWADQLPDGANTFHVGVEAASGCLRVTCPDVYYLDEGLHCPQEAMDPHHPCRPVALRVCKAELIVAETAAAGAAAEGWILDICLDYYATRNPFLDAVEAALRSLGGGEWGEEEVEAAHGTVQRYFAGPRFRRRGAGLGLKEAKEEMLAFTRLTAHLLEVALARTCGAFALEPPPPSPPPPLLSDEKAAEIRALFPGSDHSRIDAFIALLLKGGRPVIAAVEAMGMSGHVACLPAHASEWAVVEGMLRETTTLVRRLCRDFGGPPCLVLVARSARDGYTPEGMVDQIQERLLAALEGMAELTTSDGLRVLRHYEGEEEDEEEGG